MKGSRDGRTMQIGLEVLNCWVKGWESWVVGSCKWQGEDL